MTTNPLINKARNIPVIGDDIYQVGQVYDIVASPTDPDPVIALYAFWTYAPTLLWALFKPEPLDLVFDRAATGHKRKRYRRFAYRDMFRLPVPEQPGLRWATFRVAEIGQRIGWYLLVLDATTDFAVNWSTMVWQWSGDKIPGVPWAWLKGGERALARTFEPVVTSVPGDRWDFDDGGFAASNVVSIAKPGPKQMTCTATFKVGPLFGFTGVVTAAWVEIKPDGLPPIRADLDPQGGEDGVSIWGSADRRLLSEYPPCRYTLFVACTGGDLSVTAFSLSVDGAIDTPLIPDP